MSIYISDVPSKPRGPLEVTNVTLNSADLQWKPSESDGGTPITSYIIEYKQASRSSWSKAGSVDGKTTTFTVPDLSAGTEYQFRVIAVNAEGKSEPLEAADTTIIKKKIGNYHFSTLIFFCIYLIFSLQCIIL